MTSSETPEQDNGDDHPEQVEVEIIDTGEQSSGHETVHLDSETVSTEGNVSPEKKPPNLSSVGVILMGVMAVLLIIVFLNQGAADRPAAEAIAENQVRQTKQAADHLSGSEATIADKVENTTAAEISESRRQSADLSADDVADATPNTPLEVADDGENNTITSTLDDEAEQGPPKANGAPAEQRRLAAIERARQRREVRASLPQTAADNDWSADNDRSADTALREDTGVLSLVEEGPAEIATITADPGVLAAAGETSQAALPEAAQATAATAAKVISSDAVLAGQLETIKDDVKADLMAEVAADKRQLTRQGEEIDQLRQELGTALAEQDKRAEQLEARLNTLQRRDVAAATKQAALSLAVTNLQRQMASGRPFAEQLRVLEQLAPGTAGIRDLRPFAETGLPNLSSLRLGYADAARKALAAAKRGDAEGPLAKLAANLSGLFSVRRVGLVEGDNPSAIISRAEVSLEEGDLYACLKELGGLEGEAARAMTDWMAQARSLVTADQLLDDVSNRILATL